MVMVVDAFMGYLLNWAGNAKFNSF